MEPADDEEVQMDSFWRKVLNQHPIEMNLETVTSALEQGAPVDGGEGCPVTPLQHAAHTSNLRLARILWDFNANLELPAELHGGSTAMHLATRAGNEDMVLLLVAMGARVDAKDYEERTPLHFAAEAGHDVIVDLLVSYGAPVDIKDAPGLTPAQYAAREGHTHILETLSAHGCNLHTLDQDGATLLHLAAEGGHLRTVCMLLVKGVSPGVEDANRCKAEDRAHRRGWTVVVDLLQHPQDASAILGQFALEERARGDDKDDDLGYPTAAPPAAGSGDYPVKLSGKMCTKLTDSMLMLDGMYLGDNIWPSKQDLNEKEQFALEERARGDDKDDDLGYPTAAPPATSSGDYPVKLSGKMCPKLTDSMLMLDGMYLGDNIWPSKQDLNEKEQFALEERARGDDKDDDLGYPTAAPPATSSGDYPVKLSGKMCPKLTDSMLMLDGMYLGDNIWPSKQDLNEKEQFALEERARGDDKDDDLGYPTAAPPAAGSGDYPVKLSGKMCPKLTDSMLMLDGMYLGDNIWPSKQDLNEKLVAAAAEVLVKEVEGVVEHGADLTSTSTNTDEEGLQAFHLACWGGQTEVVKKLLDLDVDPRAVAAGREGVHWAAFGGHVAVLRVLKDQGCDINAAATTDGSTPLHLAADNGNLDATRWLVQHGAQIHSADDKGRTAQELAKVARAKTVVDYLNRKGDEELLLRAAASGLTNSVKQLIEKGVNVNAGSYFKGQEGWRALHLAADEGHKAVVEVLLQAGVFLDVTNAQGMTPTQLAVQAGHLEIVQLLISKLPPIETETNGRYLVHWAAIGGYVPVLDYLLTKKYNLKALTSKGETALHLAADYGNLEAVKWLVKKGINFNLRDNKGHTAEDFARKECNKEVTSFLSNLARDQEAMLLEAANEGNVRAVTRLVGCGVNVDCERWAAVSRGRRAIHFAAHKGNLDVLQELFLAGAKREVTDMNGNTALHWAALGGQVKTMQFLKTNNCKVAVVNCSSETPLHFAARANQPEALKWLLAQGVDRNIKAASGITAEDVAKRRRHHEAAEVLHNFGRNLDALRITG